jgi:hypothetical protein
MITNPFRATGSAPGASDDARKRMLAARDRIRRNLSPEFRVGIDPDEAEVVGGSAPMTPEFRGGR